jgi:hypothetical protein
MEFSEAINRNHAVISVATVTPASQLPSSSSACCATASSHDGSLEAEILGLRHQLNVLQQHGTRRALHLRWIDRALLIWLYRRCPHILHAITIVKPETVVRWHRKGFAAYWRWKARSRGGRPRIAKEVRDGPVFSSAEAGVNLELLIVYGVACFAPSAHGVKDDFY